MLGFELYKIYYPNLSVNYYSSVSYRYCETGIEGLGLKAYVLTHTDADGVGAATLYLKAFARKYGEDLDYQLIFTEPYSLYDTLINSVRVEGKKIILGILDLGANPESIGKIADYLASFGGNLDAEWIDHHIWDESWKKRIEEAGVKLIVDTSWCATGVVYKNYERLLDENDFYFASVICSADLWRWDEDLSPYIYRIVGRYNGPKGDRWRRYLVDEFLDNRIWNDDLQSMVENYVDEELSGYSSAISDLIIREHNGKRIGVTCKRQGPPNNSLLASHILSRYSLDIAVIVREDASISLRSRGEDVRSIAVCMGGGGHPRASGAHIEIPIYYKLIGLFSKSTYRRLLVRKTLENVLECLDQTRVFK